MIELVTSALVSHIESRTPDLKSWVEVHSMSAADPAPTVNRLVVALVVVDAHEHLRQYNQGPMRDAEDRLVEHVDDSAGDVEARVAPGLGPMTAAATFSLNVALTYVDAIDRLIQSRITQSKELPDDHEVIRQKILEQLAKAKISAKFQRVERTDYELRDLVVAKKRMRDKDDKAGEDEWLLSELGT
jgi:predicted RNA-binding Zn ribbon-like protein